MFWRGRRGDSAGLRSSGSWRGALEKKRVPRNGRGPQTGEGTPRKEKAPSTGVGAQEPEARGREDPAREQRP